MLNYIDNRKETEDTYDEREKKLIKTQVRLPEKVVDEVNSKPVGSCC